MTIHAKVRGLQSVRAESDVAAIIASLGSDFEAFKSQHKGELEGLRREIDAQALGSAGKELSGVTSPVGNKSDEQSALAHFARTGNIRADLSIGGGAGTGGEAVFPYVSDQIMVRVFTQSGLAPLARIVDMPDGDKFQEPQDLGEPTTAWVAETAARPALGTATMNLLEVDLNELYTLQRVTQRLLDDSRFNLGEWLAERISDKIGRSTGVAFISGAGGLEPTGLMTAPVSSSDNATRPWGTVRGIYTGVDTAISGDDLIDAIYRLQSSYRTGARWLMNSETAGYIRKLKDSDGRNLWVDGLAAGQPASLLGYPVAIDESMPAIGADNAPIAFGDFAQAYVIVRRPGLRLLQDPYSAKPNVDFYATARFGGKLQNSDAVNFIVTGTDA